MERNSEIHVADGPAAIVALLGASNLSYSLPQVVEHLVERFTGRRLDIFAAHGPGRSYGVEAGIAGVRFVGIAGSGIVEAVAARRELGQAEIWALLSDVGNDILYRSGVEQVLGWVRRIVEEFLALGGRVGITSLPVQSIERVPPWKFRLLRPLFYPFRPMAREDVLAQAREIQEGLEALGRELRVDILPTRTEWYGFDHFHLHRRHRREAFGGWVDRIVGDIPVEPQGAAGEALREYESRGDDGARGARLRISPLALRLHPPREYLLLGRRRGRPQEGLEVAPGARFFAY